MTNKAFNDHAVCPRPLCRSFGAIAVLTLFSALQSQAQVLNGTLVGTVTDPSGGFVPDARVTAKEVTRNDTREVTTNASGGFRLTSVPAGTYRIDVSKTGFRTVTLENVAVTANSEIRADAQLQVGGVNESITVAADQAVLQTDRTDVHEQLSQKQLESLPVPGRNYQALLATLPGVAPPTEVPFGGINNPSHALAISGNGTSTSGTNIQIEGVSTTNPWIQMISSAVPSQDSIQTVDVVSGSFNAEQGLSGGTAVNLQLKSGTNQFHGSAFEYYSGNRLLARPRFGLSSGDAKPKYVDNQFGGTIGGPILRNKLFFFASWERATNRQLQTGAGFTLPTGCLRQGLFTQKIYDPNTGDAATGLGRTPFPQVNFAGGGNCAAGSYYQIPASRWDAPIAKFLPTIPLPTDPNTTQIGGNFFAKGNYGFNSNKIDIKGDYNATSKLRVSARYSSIPFNEIVASAFGDQAGGPPPAYQGQPGTTSGNIQSSTLEAVYVASANLVIDARVGFTYQATNQAPPLFGVNYGQDTLGIPNADGPLPLNSGVPQFSPNGFTDFGTWYSAINYHNPTKQAAVNLNWTKGSHNIRTGFEISHVDLNQSEALFSYSDFRYNGGATSLVSSVTGGQPNGDTPTPQNGWADFLLGLASNVQKEVLFDKWATLRTKQTAIYAQDQWKVTHKLTLNYGLRWNYYPVPTRDHRGIEIYDPKTNNEYICGRAPGVPEDCGVHVSPKLFSPLMGVAYQWNDRTVIRAGGGLNYLQQNMYRDGVYAYPSQIAYNQSGPNNYVPLQKTSAGLPVIPLPNLSTGVVPVPAGYSLQTLPSDYKRGYVESWNLTIERQLPRGFVGQVAYVGTQTVHQQARYNINVGTPGGGAASAPFYSTVGTAPVTMLLPLEHMRYNSLQSELRHNFSNGFQMAAHYTWSKWLGVCCDAISDGQPAIPLPQYNALNRALMPGDRTHNFNVTSVLELPFGKGKRYLSSGMVARAVGGWQTNFIITAFSGTPFTVSSPAGPLNAPGLGNQRATQVKQNVAIYGSPDNYFDTSAFIPTAGAVFGNAGFDSLRGPGTFNFDAGIFRTFPIVEKINLQFKAEAFNVTNTVHYANPVSDITAGNVGQITGTAALGGRLGIDQRQFRLALHLHF